MTSKTKTLIASAAIAGLISGSAVRVLANDAGNIAGTPVLEKMSCKADGSCSGKNSCKGEKKEGKKHKKKGEKKDEKKDGDAQKEDETKTEEGTADKKAE